jgi:hypothetical protein
MRGVRDLRGTTGHATDRGTTGHNTDRGTAGHATDRGTAGHATNSDGAIAKDSNLEEALLPTTKLR